MGAGVLGLSRPELIHPFTGMRPARFHRMAAQSKNYQHSTNLQMVIDANIRLVIALGDPKPGNCNGARRRGTRCIEFLDVGVLRRSARALTCGPCVEAPVLTRAALPPYLSPTPMTKSPRVPGADATRLSTRRGGATADLDFGDGDDHFAGELDHPGAAVTANAASCRQVSASPDHAIVHKGQKMALTRR
jgi:hypothetical protein